MTKRYIALSLLGLALLLTAAGCKKKIPAPPRPHRRQVTKTIAAPVIATLVAEPGTIDRGQSSTLRWVVEGADEVSINNGIGTVMASGSRQVFPSNTTTYTLTARNAGGSSTRSVTVNVNVPPPPAPPKPTEAPKASLEQRVSQLVDAYFDYDKFSIRPDAARDLTRDADLLKSIFQEFPSARLILGGYCDPRGSAEYNLGLGDRRARSAVDFLANLGVDTGKIRPVSYGEEVQVCSEENEDCYQRNRRVHFATGN
ncbi:MAG: OmpA family protein [Bryobacterales bacterium]|nr:OmpA family protein [Bryobacterales bacterium]